MGAHAARSLVVLISIAAATVVAGCGGGSDRRFNGSTTASSTSGTASTNSGSGTTVAGSTSGSSSAPSGSGATPAATPAAPTPPAAPDLDPPLVTLASPLRGLFTTQTQVLVAGTVTDQTGVAYFLVNGLPVLPGAGGNFGQLVQLTSGLNVIELEAADPLGHRVKSALPVVSGQFLPEASLVRDALAARLNRPAFDAIERVAATQLSGPALAQQIMSQNPLFQGGAALATIRVDATAVSFGTPTVDLDPRTGGLGVHVEVPAIDVTTRASGQVIGIGYGINVHVTATRAVFDATAVVNVAAGVVTTTLQNVNVDLQGFRFDVGGIPAVLENLARNAVRGFLERQIEQQVATIVPAEINRAIAGANGPITRTVLGRQVTLQLVPTLVRFDPDGCSVLTDGDMVVVPPPGLILPTTPGSLRTTGAPPVFGTTPAVLLGLDDDMLNRIGHAAWRGGLMSFKVDQAMAQTFGLPAWLQLDAFLLQIFFPSLSGLNPSDPLELELAAAATPPLFKTLPTPGLLEAGIGDMTLSIFVAPAAGPRVLVFQVAVQVRMGLGASVSAQNTLTLSVVGRPLIRSDVTAMPMGRLDDLAVENFLDFVLPPVLQLLPRAWSGFPLPTHPAVQLRNVQVESAQDWVTLKSDV